MSIHLTLRAVTLQEWKRVNKLSESDVARWLFSLPPSSLPSVSRDQVAQLTREERKALLNERFSCRPLDTDRLLLDYRWCKVVDTYLGMMGRGKSGLEHSSMPNLLRGCLRTGIPSVYGFVGIYSSASIESTISHVGKLERNETIDIQQLALGNEELFSIDFDSMRDGFGKELWGTVDRIERLFSSFQSSEYLILEYSH